MRYNLNLLILSIYDCGRKMKTHAIYMYIGIVVPSGQIHKGLATYQYVPCGLKNIELV